MGGSASKGARQLPKSVPTATRSAPEWAKTNLPSDPPPPPPSQVSQNTASAQSTITPQTSSSRSSLGGQHGRLESGTGLSGDEPRGQPIGRSTTQFSGDKDDVVKRDALDPHFAANLSRLGQVKINDAGQFIPTLSSAQKTLTARQEILDVSAESDVPPPGHLSAVLLGDLLDGLKSVRTKRDVDALYERYAMDRKDMEVIRKWVNSPSVGSVEKIHSGGAELTEMKAVWVEKKV